MDLFLSGKANEGRGNKSEALRVAGGSGDWGSCLGKHLALLKQISCLLSTISFLQVDTGMCPIGPQENVSQVFHCCVLGGDGEWEVTGRPPLAEGEPWVHSMGLSAAIRGNRSDKQKQHEWILSAW